MPISIVFSKQNKNMPISNFLVNKPAHTHNMKSDRATYCASYVIIGHNYSFQKN